MWLYSHHLKSMQHLPLDPNFTIKSGRVCHICTCSFCDIIYWLVWWNVILNVMQKSSFALFIHYVWALTTASTIYMIRLCKWCNRGFLFQWKSATSILTYFILIQLWKSIQTLPSLHHAKRKSSTLQTFRHILPYEGVLVMFSVVCA